MKENYLNPGDLVTVIRWDGGTGKILSQYAKSTVFEVLGIEKFNSTVGEYIAEVRPLNSNDEPITANWDRLKKVPLMEGESEYAEILQAQEIYRNVREQV